MTTVTGITVMTGIPSMPGITRMTRVTGMTGITGMTRRTGLTGITGVARMNGMTEMTTETGTTRMNGVQLCTSNFVLWCEGRGWANVNWKTPHDCRITGMTGDTRVAIK